MTPEQFCYWLQGFSEVNGKAPTEQEWRIIQDHLKTVFHKVTPIPPVLWPNLEKQQVQPPYNPWAPNRDIAIC